MQVAVFFSMPTNLVPRFWVFLPDVIDSSIKEWSPVCIFRDRMEFSRIANAGIHGVRVGISGNKSVLVF